jgi:hypothetical protein
MGWLRVSKTVWEQYVGRRVIRLRSGSGALYVAYAGKTLCGRWTTLEHAQHAAERSGKAA